MDGYRVAFGWKAPASRGRLLPLLAALVCSQISGLVTGKPAAARPSRIDRFVRQEMGRQHIPGLSLAVVQDGKVRILQGYGLANVELRVPATPRTVYQIQSVTKSFTAAGIVSLAREGKVRLDDPVARYLDGLPESWRGITLRHLLSHTSGIKDFVNEPVRDLRLETTPEQILQDAAARPLNFSPGERWRYSNTNYVLLGMVIRKVSGLDYAGFLGRQFFEPLGMKRTRAVSLREIIPDTASGYLFRDDQLRRGEFTAESVLNSAGGGLCSTVEDLATFEAALARGEILSRELQRQLWTPTQLKDGSSAEYGLGWFVGHHRAARLIQHGGGHTTGFAAKYLRFPEQRLSVIVLCNQRDCDPDRIAQGVAGLFCPELMPAALLPEADDPDPAVSIRLCRAVAALAGNSPDLSGVAPGLPSLLTQNTRAFLGAALPQPTSLRLLAVDHVRGRGLTANGYQIAELRHYRMPLQGRHRFFTFFLTEAGQVGGLTCWEE